MKTATQKMDQHADDLLTSCSRIAATRSRLNARRMSDASKRCGLEEDTGEPAVVSLLQMVLPVMRHNRPTSQSRDLDLLSRATTAIVEAAGSGILTEDEAKAVVRFLVSRFAARRLDRVLESLSSPNESRWFVAASKTTAHG